MGNSNVINNTNTLHRGIGISSIFYLIYASYYISGYSSKAHNYIIIVLFAIWAIFALIEDIKSFNKAVSNDTLLWATLFLFYYFFTSIFFGDLINTMEYMVKYILLFACVFQFKYYQARKNPREMKFIVVCTFFVWSFFAMKAILFYITVPSAARTLASNFYAFDNIAIGGGYAIAFGSALLCVYLFERLINRKTSKKSIALICGAIVLLLFYLLIKTESTLTLIACAVGMVLAIVRKIWCNNGKMSTLNRLFLTVTLLVLSIIIIFNFQEIGEWIIAITKDGTENTIIRRFNRVGQKMAYYSTGSTYENYIDERFGYIEQSWKTFLKNPIFGVGFKSGNIFSKLKNNGVGMHSAICDILAQHGIVGFLPFLMFFIKAILKECKAHYNTYIAVMLFMALVNPFEYFHAYAAIFTLIPMIELLITYPNQIE